MQSSLPKTYTPLELQPLPPEDWPCVDDLITEDGAPVDSVFSEKQMRLLTEPLYSSWKVDRPFVAFANVGMFYAVGVPPIVPDVLLSVDVRLPENIFPKGNRSYFVWAYGKPPEVAIEIVSNRQGGEDSEKLLLYQTVRVANYFIYDPEFHLSKTPLRAFRLRGSAYEEIKADSFMIEELGLGLLVWTGRFEDTDSKWLRWCDAAGVLIPTGAQRAELSEQRAGLAEQRAEAESRRAEAESRRAEAESQRAEAESQRAEAESRRADAAAQAASLVAADKQRLIELLHRHGIDPAT